MAESFCKRYTKIGMYVSKVGFCDYYVYCSVLVCSAVPRRAVRSERSDAIRRL